MCHKLEIVAGVTHKITIEIILCFQNAQTVWLNWKLAPQLYYIMYPSIMLPEAHLFSVHPS